MIHNELSNENSNAVAINKKLTKNRDNSTQRFTFDCFDAMQKCTVTLCENIDNNNRPRFEQQMFCFLNKY